MNECLVTKICRRKVEQCCLGQRVRVPLLFHLYIYAYMCIFGFSVSLLLPLIRCADLVCSFIVWV